MSKPVPEKPRIAHRRKARNLLVQALYQWQLAGGEADAIEAQYRGDNPGKIDWELFHHALTFIHTNAAALDELFVPYLDRALKDLDPIELAILRLGSFELQERIDVPYKVVINECIDLAKKFGASESHKYINGVLDRLAGRLRTAETGSGRAGPRGR